MWALIRWDTRDSMTGPLHIWAPVPADATFDVDWRAYKAHFLDVGLVHMERISNADAQALNALPGVYFFPPNHRASFSPSQANALNQILVNNYPTVSVQAGDVVKDVIRRLLRETFRYKRYWGAFKREPHLHIGDLDSAFTAAEADDVVVSRDNNDSERTI